MPKIVADRELFSKIYAQPKWARTKADHEVLRGARKKHLTDDDDSESGLTSDLSRPIGQRRRGTMLPSSTIHMSRVTDANGKAFSQGILKAVAWHPCSSVLATAGLDRMLRLFHIDGKLNPVIQSVQLKDMPIFRLAFVADGSELFITGQKKFFYTLNVETGALRKYSTINCLDASTFEYVFTRPQAPNGCLLQVGFIMRDGHVVFIDAPSKQLAYDLKLAARDVNHVSFSKDGRVLLVTGGLGKNVVFIWDMVSRSCLGSFTDEGSIKTNLAVLSPDGKWLVTAQSSGVVNIYNFSSLPLNWTEHAADHLTEEFFKVHLSKPCKAVMNLTTSITAMAFHPSSQILAICSSKKKDALRLVHFPTLTVFRNWPTAATPVGRAVSVSFSPNGQFLSVANDKGRVLLYKIQHFWHAASV